MPDVPTARGNITHIVGTTGREPANVQRFVRPLAAHGAAPESCAAWPKTRDASGGEDRNRRERAAHRLRPRRPAEPAQTATAELRLARLHQEFPSRRIDQSRR